MKMKFSATRYITIFLRRIQRLQICKIPTDVIVNHCVFSFILIFQGYKGISCFLVPRETEGLEIGPKEDKV